MPNKTLLLFVGFGNDELRAVGVVASPQAPSPAAIPGRLDAALGVSSGSDPCPRPKWTWGVWWARWAGRAGRQPNAAPGCSAHSGGAGGQHGPICMNASCLDPWEMRARVGWELHSLCYSHLMGGVSQPQVGTAGLAPASRPRRGSGKTAISSGSGEGGSVSVVSQ